MHIYDLTLSVGQGSHLAGSPGSESLPRLQLHKAWLKEYTFKLRLLVGLNSCGPLNGGFRSS